MSDCVFCKILKKELPAEIIYENENFFAIPDANQKVEGHCLVISKKHFKDTLEIPNAIGSDFLDCLKAVATRVVDSQDAEGFNIVSNNGEVAGQAVLHVHYHILPRHKNDSVPVVY